MKSILLRSIMGATLCMLAGGAFAQDVQENLGVSNDVSLRSDGANADKTGGTATTIEMKNDINEDTKVKQDFVGLMSFEVPYKSGYAIKSVTLRVVTERAKGTMNIYAFNSAISDADTYNTQAENIATARSAEPLVSVRLNGTKDKAVTDTDASSVLEDWVNQIDLTSYVKEMGAGTLNLLFTNNAEYKEGATSIKIYTSDAQDVTNTKVSPNFTFKGEDLKPLLIVEYEKSESQKNYSTTSSADTWIRKNNTSTHQNETTMEIHTNESMGHDFLGLMSFDVPDELHYSNMVVSKATLRLVSERVVGDRTTNIYAYPSFVENTKYADEANNVTEARENKLATFKAVGNVKTITSDGLTDNYKTIDKWTNYVDLTDYLSSLEENNFSIMIESVKTGNQMTKFFTRDAADFINGDYSFSKEDLVPQLTVDYALATHDLNVTAAGAATLVLPYEAEIPENVRAYTLEYTSGDKAVATELKEVIPANTPVLINAEQGKYTFTATATLTKKADAPAAGCLHGAWEAVEVPVGSYVLQNQSGAVGFYRVEEEGLSIKPNQAYLTASAARGAKLLNIEFGGEATAIDGVEAAAEKKATGVFTIDGKKADASRLVKGQVYVTNGKTFILK